MHFESNILKADHGSIGNRATFDVPIMTSLLSSIEDNAWTAGYLADTEEDGHFPRFACPKQSSTKRRCPGTFYGQHANSIHSHYYIKTRERKRRRTSMEGRRWIQRIYSNTPFSLSVVQDIEALDDVSRIVGVSSRDNEKWPKPMSARPIHLDDLRGLQLPHKTSTHNTLLTHPSHLSTMLLTDKKGAIDLEDEYTSLLSVVSALLQECQESQAQYRTYSPILGVEETTTSHYNG